MSGEETNSGAVALAKIRTDAQVVAGQLFDFITEGKIKDVASASLIIGLISTLGGVLIKTLKDPDLTEEEKKQGAEFFFAHLDTMTSLAKREIYGNQRES